MRAKAAARALAPMTLGILIGFHVQAAPSPPAAAPARPGLEGPAAPVVATPDEAPPDLAQASQDLESGLALLQAKKGSNRLVRADAAFTAVITRLTPAQETLDAEGRLVLLRALDGRAQTHVLRGRLKAADADFGSLVTLDPSYEPDPEKTPRRTMDRFKKIRTPRIGYLSLKIDPPDAEILLDGRSLGPASSLPPERAVLTGPFTLRARRDCYEEKEITGTVAVGEKMPVVMALDPFARVVRFETSPAGFDIDIDGTFVGTTVARPPEDAAPPDAAPADIDAGSEALPPPPESEGASANGAPERVAAPAGEANGNGVLELACVAAGRHAYTVRRNCYADVRGTLDVEIDLLDRTPIVVPAVAPLKRETRLSVTSDTPGAVIYLDGVPAGPVPIRDRIICAPDTRIEAKVADRVIWSETRTLEDGPLEIAARRRPTLAVAVADTREEAPPTVWVERMRARWSALTSFNLTSEARAQTDPAPGSVTVIRDEGLPTGPPADLRLEVNAKVRESRKAIQLRLVPLALPGLAFESTCSLEDDACLDRYFDALDAAWETAADAARPDEVRITAPGSLKIPLPRAIAAAMLDVSVLPPGRARNVSLMELASALLGAGAYREALDQALERPLWAENVAGPASRGTAAFLAGICHQELGDHAAARAAFARGAADPAATLWNDHLPVAPLSRLMLAAGK